MRVVAHYVVGSACGGTLGCRQCMWWLVRLWDSKWQYVRQWTWSGGTLGSASGDMLGGGKRMIVLHLEGSVCGRIIGSACGCTLDGGQ